MINDLLFFIFISFANLTADPSHLEEVLREQIAHGQARKNRPWKKIIVIIEGIYSMEGELCKLLGILAVCKKYKVQYFLNSYSESPTISFFVYFFFSCSLLEVLQSLFFLGLCSYSQQNNYMSLIVFLVMYYIVLVKSNTSIMDKKEHNLS